MSVYFIQEVHCTGDNIHDWRAEWGYQALFSCCCSNIAGVAILFNNNFSFQLLKAYTDPKGFIICDLITNGKLITLANIYAPNEDDPDFFTSVRLSVRRVNCWWRFQPSTECWQGQKRWSCQISLKIAESDKRFLCKPGFNRCMESFKPWELQIHVTTKETWSSL